MEVQKLDDLYERYGYEVKKNLSSDKVRVYTLNKGIYYGADIVTSQDVSEISGLQNELSRAGYAVRIVAEIDFVQVENRLFESFFNSAQLNQRLGNKYSAFKASQTNILKVDYQYIPASFLLDDQEAEHNNNIIESVCSRLDESGAHLIIIEAAAGFGKTCTSYELIRYMSENIRWLSPIFTELSRDRRASVFKHILQDVILNEFHSLLDERLVVSEIQSGRIPLVIDGFDELLSREQDTGGDEFDQVETMLSTIGDLLKSNAKIILTGRKTAIFAGDSFQEWVENNPNDFQVSRYLINPPLVKDWLDEEKISLMNSAHIPIRDIANPVLLAFLRSLDPVDFKYVIEKPEDIVKKYFEAILDRERERQELLITPEDQIVIFRNVAVAMLELNITSESKEWIKYLIEEQNRNILDEVRKSYPSNSRPTIDQLCNTLSNHALLDRKGNEGQIGFINDFIFGTFIGQGIQAIAKEKVKRVSSRMLELATTAYQFQSKASRDDLWRVLQWYDKFTKQERFENEYLLQGEVVSLFDSASFIDLSVTGLRLDKERQFVSCVFANCCFDKCFFLRSSFVNNSFVNCVFRDCEIEGEVQSSSSDFYFVGCEDYDSGFIESCTSMDHSDVHSSDLRKTILFKFFNINTNRPRFRKISQLLKELPGDQRGRGGGIIDSFKKDGYIKTNGDNAFLTDKGIQLFNDYGAV